MSRSETQNHVPIVFDLDGTLIYSDTAYDLFIEHVKERGLIGFCQLCIWFFRDKAEAKSRLASLYVSSFDPSLQPYTRLIEHPLYRECKNKALVSGSGHDVVQKIAEYLGGFNLAQGAMPGKGNIGEEKALFLQRTYPNGFDYVGDSKADIAVWKVARKAYSFRASNRVRKAAEIAGVPLIVLAEKEGGIDAMLKQFQQMVDGIFGSK